MNLTLVDKIADAVLYEGYMLYPYRASAVKNRQRWNFGAVYPETFSAASSGTDACVMQTQCLVTGDAHTAIDVRVRFLHLLAREVALVEDGESRIENRRLRIVESLEVDGKLLQTWQEAVEREAGTNGIGLAVLCANAERITFGFPASYEEEPLRDGDGKLAGVMLRRQQAIDGALELSAERIGDKLFKITARISNMTGMNLEELKNRDDALMRSLVSTHTILSVRGGEFVSLLEPPDHLGESVKTCSNIGTYPVLVGESGERDLMLSSPIILYDYPAIAPESAGELFDSTEIDEILTLRIMTLTDEEKREMRDVDDRARRILERTESMPMEQLMKLHGAVRGLRPVVKQ